ncbi:MAG: ATP-binding cassette domain-containing protein, partial [Anaerolineae bacterium]|nr:ATP-binding cassette domain-containing protein [Anaerolineae bacterium]
MLEVSHIRVCYDQVPAIHDVSFRIEEGEIVSIIGANGAGKSTLLRTVSGLLHPTQGTIEFQDQKIDHLPPHNIVELGISHVPEGRRLFQYLTVQSNLRL